MNSAHLKLLLLLLAPGLLMGCSEEWHTVTIASGFDDPAQVVPDSIDRVHVEAVASTDVNTPLTCTVASQWFRHDEGTLGFPIELVIMPSEDRDYNMVALRVTAYQGSDRNEDVVLRAEHFFIPEFESRESSELVLDQRCHADNGEPLPCAEGEICEIDPETELGHCVTSTLTDLFNSDFVVIPESCDGSGS